MNERDRASARIVVEFSQLIAKKSELRFSGFGEGIDHETGRVRLICAEFTHPRIGSVDEARPLLLDTVTALLAYVNNQESFKEYQSQIPFTWENVEVGISSVDSQPGEVAFMFTRQNHLNYFGHSENPDQLAAVKLGAETIEEALQILQYPLIRTDR